MRLNLSNALTILCIMGGAISWPHQGAAQAVTTATLPSSDASPAAGAASAPSGAGTSATDAAAAPLPEGVTPEMMADGQKLFLQNCRRCHGMRGKAGVPLSGNENIADPSYIASMIINGRGYMPALGEHLSDEQIALIGTFARNSWGNAFGPVTPQDVKDMR